MNYFAYGSNMLKSRVNDQERCPKASLIGSAVLGGYIIRFNKSSSDGSGKCNIVKCTSTDSEVLGILYEIDEAEFIVLDKVESGYCRELVALKSQDTSNVLEAQTYIAKPQAIDDSIAPYEWYKALVIAGALEHEFPEKYINTLRQFSSKRDPDEKRRNRELESLGRIPAKYESGCLTQACTMEVG